MKEAKRSVRSQALVSTVACILSSHALAAPQSESSAPSTSLRLEEIVVTAQRKAERLQDVPIAVNVVSGETLQAKGLSASFDLPTLVPGLSFVTTGGAGTPYLRGIGSNAGNPNDEPSVATYVDGVYIASSYANKMNLNNLERIEVLKGPQGTLFGRNATGGVIQLVTRDPQQESSAEVAVGYGNYDTLAGNLYLTGGLTDTLAIDFAAQGEKQDKGWGELVPIDRDIQKHKNYSVRSKVLFEPADGLAFRLSGDYEKADSRTSYTLPQGVQGIDGSFAPADEYDSNAVILLEGQGSPGTEIEQTGVSLRADYEMSFAQLVSISAYRNSRGQYDAEADATVFQVVDAKLPIETDTYSQELQLISPSGSKIDWVSGLYLYQNKAGYVDATFAGAAFAATGGAFQIQAKQKTESVSAYAQGTMEVLPDTRLTLGARYTDEDQSFVDFELFRAPAPFPAPADRGFKKWTWRAAVDYAFTSDIHSYVSFNRGVKGGGYDLLDPFNAGFDPEVLDAYEVGLKTELLDQRLRLNASYFYYDFQNIQVQVVGARAGSIISTTNAAAATITGLDVDFQFLALENLILSGGFAWINGEYDEFPGTVSYPASPLSGPPTTIDAGGNDTIRTPDVSGNLTVEYRVQSGMGEFPLSVTYSYNGGYFFGADNRLEQDTYSLLNAAIGWTASDSRYGVTLWGRNLADEYYLNQGVPSGTGDLVEPAAPRTYGVTFRAKF
jgi:iron complex outermembrane recepter protein